MEDLVSVIVPVYNSEKYLGECVDSIVNQSYRNLEIILVDDGSTDTSGAICDRYAQNDSRVHVIHKKNGGNGDARNAGLKIATGQWITMSDNDDIFHKRQIEVLLAAARKKVQILLSDGTDRLLSVKYHRMKRLTTTFWIWRR